jgi:hypothetical protein
MTTNILQESRGFAARKPGDQFVDPTNPEDLATFQGLSLLPDDGTPSFDSNQDFLDAYRTWKQQAEQDRTVYELNKPISVIRSAMVVNMDTPRGLESFVLFTKDNRILERKLTDIPPHTVPNQGGYVLNRATSLSERAGLKPSDVLSGRKLYSVSQVARLLDGARATAGDEAVDQMQGYLTALAKKQGKDHVIKNGAKNASLHQKYLGEWAAPIALITSQFEPLSQLPELEDAMLEGQSIKNAKIIYNTNVSEALFDSSIDLKGMEIYISSKAHKGGGAAASLKGLYDTIHGKQDEFPSEFWNNPKNQKFRDIVDAIMTKSAIDGVLELAAQEKVMPRTDITKVKDAINSKDADESAFSVATQRMMADYAANKNHPNYNAGRHALAIISRKLCKKLNAENYTDAAKAVLNKSSVVQMMFVTGIKGPDLVAKGFHLVWPPKFDGTIKFFADKAFSATEIKGRLGFKISKGVVDDVPEPDESLQAPSISKVEIAKKKQEAERAVGKITALGSRDKRDPKVKDVVALGREMKKR